jgi:thiamine transport system substrate-binding protein
VLFFLTFLLEPIDKPLPAAANDVGPATSSDFTKKSSKYRRVFLGIFRLIFLVSAPTSFASLRNGSVDRLLASSAQAANFSVRPELTIYVYDSFVAPGGLGPEIFPLFEKECGCTIRPLSSGDGGQLLTRLQLDSERGKPAAQLVVGLDGPTSLHALPYVEAAESSSKRVPSLELAPEVRDVLPAAFLPYDFGYFAFMADRDALKKLNLNVPRHFSDLLKPEWRRDMIVEDPRTSTPGLAFVLYANALGADWSKLRSQWLTLAPSWDGAYGLFLQGEAPLVWSYTTSQAYHEEHGDSGSSRRYFAVIFDEGQPIQVEGAALVKGAFAGVEGASKRALAEKFLAFLLSPRAQALIPQHNWMYPARAGVKLPASFEHLPKPAHVVPLMGDPAQLKRALDDWARALRQ